jgi:hypothetical protein
MLNVFALTKTEVESIAENESLTMLERLIAKAVIKDFSKGSLWNFESLLNRAIGKETIQTQNEKTEVVFVEGKTIL